MVTERPNNTDDERQLFQLLWRTPSMVIDYFRQRAKVRPLTPEEIIKVNRPGARHGA